MHVQPFGRSSMCRLGIQCKLCCLLRHLMVWVDFFKKWPNWTQAADLGNRSSKNCLLQTKRVKHFWLEAVLDKQNPVVQHLSFWAKICLHCSQALRRDPFTGNNSEVRRLCEHPIPDRAGRLSAARHCESTGTQGDRSGALLNRGHVCDHSGCAACLLLIARLPVLLVAEQW